ncbi:hypothetical protein [Streptomyces noursei]|uniref:hypothetical protein n=1 Tax=Streptomyces noursei TaxID=1971 RepID=UPI0035DCDFD7
MPQHSRASRPTALTESEILALPAAVPLEAANRALGLGRTIGYRLAKNGAYPIPVLRVSNAYRCRRADIITYLRIRPASEAA